MPVLVARLLPEFIKKFSLSAFIAIFIFAVLLSGRTEAQSLDSCAAIENPAERLACYDKLSGRLPPDKAKSAGTARGPVDPVVPRADVIVPTAPAAAPTAPVIEKRPDAEAVFGFEHKPIPEEELLDELRIKWTQKKKDGYGKWVIKLENGQVWQQTGSRRFNFVNPEHWVVIYRGALGSFFLGEPERRNGIRVKRVK